MLTHTCETNERYVVSLILRFCIDKNKFNFPRNVFIELLTDLYS